MTFGVELDYHYKDKEWVCFEHKEWEARAIKMETILAWLDSIEIEKNKWMQCHCGRRATMNGACDECYIHSYVRSEEEGGDCCVCHENDGRWVKLDCGHILHNHCFFEIKVEAEQKRKCPLCRHQSRWPLRYDCYDD